MTGYIPLCAVAEYDKLMQEKKVTAKSYKPAHGGRPGDVNLFEELGKRQKEWGIHPSYRFFKPRTLEELLHIFSNPGGNLTRINIHKGPVTSSSYGCKEI